MNTIKHLIIMAAIGAIFFTSCTTTLPSTQRRPMSDSASATVPGNSGSERVAVNSGSGSGGFVTGYTLGYTAMSTVRTSTMGGNTGAIISKNMDEQADEMKQVLGDAEVKRAGEAIVVEFKERVLFGFDRSNLAASAEQNLDKLIAVLQEYPDTNIEILGHTDSKGSRKYNQRLSEKRADAVASYIKSNAVTASRISIKGLGESEPVASNATDEGRAENRRVEFVITANQKMIDEANREANK